MNFLEFVKNNEITLLDGAMGTELKKRDVMGDFNNNIENKEIVKNIHESYLKAGSDAIITNTFSMNELYLNDKNEDYDLDLLNRAGVKLAKEAADSTNFVLGDIGSTGKLLKPYGEYEEEEFIEVFKEKAQILADEGVDAFIIETMVDLREAVTALKACKSTVDLPLMVSLSYNSIEKGGRTVMGHSAAEVAQKLQKEGADIIGTNCGSLDPKQMAEIVKVLKDNTDLPIMVEPNAGQPKLKGEETVYDMGPSVFSEGIMACIEAGAQIVGGCCGTTPEHIKELALRLGKI